MNETEFTAYSGARIFDGEAWHDNACLIVRDAKVHGIGAPPEGASIVRLAGGLIVPGYVDLQVNGGGGHLIGPNTAVENLRRVCAVHAQFGVTSLLPTLITNTPAVTDKVLAAGATAARTGTPGFLGLHLEGPHLSVARKGAHDPAFIRPMTESELVRLERAPFCRICSSPSRPRPSRPNRSPGLPGPASS